MLSATFNPSGNLLQNDSTHGRLHFGHPPVGAKRFMEPAKSRAMLSVMDCVIVLAMVFVAPGTLPEVGVIGCEHPAFARGCHDLVLPKRECRGVPHGSSRASLVGGPLR